MAPSSRPWTWRQRWCDLLFAHWPIAAAKLRSFVPAALHIQEFDGSAWVGLVPFRMDGVMRRPLPDLPWISAFPEMNLRVYVELAGKPGVWFISLDAANPLAVWGARRLFHLPYHHASMSVRRIGERVAYRSHRSGTKASVAFEAVYWPASQPYQAKPGTLEHFLTERYCLYAQAPGGILFRTEVHHAPWPLQQGGADVALNTVGASQNVIVDEVRPLLHFSRTLDVVVWPPRRA